jgi:nucleoside triphosphate diphosphatase
MPKNMTDQPRYSIDDLLHLMARLRDPDTGCPWDIQQNFSSLVPFTVEEVYEVVDSIERGDYSHLGEELGDLLFQVVFYARVAEEGGCFDFAAVVDGIVRKLLARHPHVFPDGTLASTRVAGKTADEQEVKEQWEAIKADERTSKGHRRLLADIPAALPALVRAQKIQKRAAKAGFDWDTMGGVIAKIREEVEELQGAIDEGDQEHIADELGDLLFSCVNLARHAGLDSETVLRRATRKFEHRFDRMEELLESRGRAIGDCDADAQDALWREAKASLAQG